MNMNKKKMNEKSISKKNMIRGCLFFIIIAGSIMIWQRYTSHKIQQNLKNNLIRFHVRANSDSRFDQACKLKVRDAVIGKVSQMMDGADTKEEAFYILKIKKQNKKYSTGNIKERGSKTKGNRTFCTGKIPREKLWTIYISRRYLRCIKNRSRRSQRPQLVVCHVPGSLRNKR